LTPSSAVSADFARATAGGGRGGKRRGDRGGNERGKAREGVWSQGVTKKSPVRAAGKKGGEGVKSMDDVMADMLRYSSRLKTDQRASAKVSVCLGCSMCCNVRCSMRCSMCCSVC